MFVKLKPYRDARSHDYYYYAEFPGHPDGINSLIAVTDNVVITGCEDGVIRAVHLYPHR